MGCTTEAACVFHTVSEKYAIITIHTRGEESTVPYVSCTVHNQGKLVYSLVSLEVFAVTYCILVD